MEPRKVIQFRVTQSQYERIILKKENEGYSLLAQFVRDKLLKDDLATEKMIQEIHKKVVGDKSKKKDEEDEENKIGV